MAAENRILSDPAVCHGEPVVAGARVPVTIVVGRLAGGMTMDEVQREYDVTADDIRAAPRYVGEFAEQESFHRLPAA
jgi:uncharacterized protein (DUF433 family)